MKVEGLVGVALTVKNLDEAISLFSDLLGTTFEKIHSKVAKGEVKFEKTITKHADRAFEETKIKVAISPIGLELIETIPPTEKEGIRSFLLKVSNLEEAKAEMELKGIRLVAEAKIGGLKEAIYSPDDLRGARLTLVEYDAPTPIEAILQK